METSIQSTLNSYNVQSLEEAYDYIFSKKNDPELSQSLEYAKVMRDTIQRKNMHNTRTLVEGILKDNDKVIDKNVPLMLKTMGKHIDELSALMSTPGPEKRIKFNKEHELNFINSTGINIDDVNRSVKSCAKIQDNFNTLNNPFYVLSSVLSSYHYKKNTIYGKTEVSKMITVYLGLRIYKSAFATFFKHFEPNPDTMALTIDKLNSNRFNIKKYKTIYNTIIYIAQSHHDNFKDILEDSIDDNITYYIINLTNRIRFMMKLISNLYYENHEKGLKQTTDSVQAENDEGDKFLNDIQNVSTLILSNSRKIFMRLVSDVTSDPRILITVCKMTTTSESKFALTLNKMMHDKEPLLEKLIIKMLAYFYTTGNKNIKSQKFINVMYGVYSVSNSVDPRIIEIKDILHKIMHKYHDSYRQTNHAGMLSNLRKCLHLYITFYIVKVV